MEAQAGPGQGRWWGVRQAKQQRVASASFSERSVSRHTQARRGAGCGPIRIGRPDTAAGLPLADNASGNDRTPVGPRSQKLQGSRLGVLRCGH